MNPSIIAHPRASRFALGLFSVFAAASVAASAATEEVLMKLGGKQFGHGKSLKANSGTKTINGSKLYEYKISGTIRGKDGALGAAFPNEVPLDKFLNSLKSGNSSILTGAFENPTGARPATLVSKSMGGQRDIKGVGLAKIKVNLAIQVSSTGQLSLEVTNVKMTVDGKPLSGRLVFGKSSSVTVSTAPIVEFKATGQPAFAETAGNASVTVWRVGNKMKAASVQVATVDGTAKAGIDYTATNVTVSFAAGEVEKTVLVPIIDNAIKDKNRKFTLTVSAPGSGTVLGSKLTNTVTIADND